MTSKEALRQLQVYCAANGSALYPSGLPEQTYSIILADGDGGGITARYPNKRISGYSTPEESLIWIEGYHAALQMKRSDHESLFCRSKNKTSSD